MHLNMSVTVMIPIGFPPSFVMYTRCTREVMSSSIAAASESDGDTERTSLRGAGAGWAERKR